MRLSELRRSSPGTGSGSRSTRRATRRSAPASPPTSPGPRRHRYGAMRDLVIGVTVVLADGTIASSGGKVVKNVAGYDLGEALLGLARPARPDRARSRCASTRARRRRRPSSPRATTRARSGGSSSRSQLEPSAVDFLPPGRLARPLRGQRGRASPRRCAACPGEPADAPVWDGERGSARSAPAAARPSTGRSCLLARPGVGLAFVAEPPPRALVAARRARARRFDPRGSPR